MSAPVQPINQADSITRLRQRMIREVEPPKPSTKISTSDGLPLIAANRSVEPVQLGRQIKGDLDWIVIKCLEKDRDRRYETADGLARDIQRYLAGLGYKSEGYEISLQELTRAHTATIGQSSARRLNLW